MGLELEVDERLHIARLNLDDHEDEDDDEEGFDHKRTTGDEVLQLVCQELWHEVEDIAQQHEECHGLVGGAPLEEYLRLKLAEYLMEHLFGDAEGGSTEEHPTSSNEVESEQAT